MANEWHNNTDETAQKKLQNHWARPTDDAL